MNKEKESRSDFIAVVSGSEVNVVDSSNTEHNKREPDFDNSGVEIDALKDSRKARNSMVSGVDDSVSFTSDNKKLGKLGESAARQK